MPSELHFLETQEPWFENPAANHLLAEVKRAIKVLRANYQGEDGSNSTSDALDILQNAVDLVD